MGDKRDFDLAIAGIAARQHGVITHPQLRLTGLGREAISKRARRGRLHRLHQGVYAVGHAGVSREGQWLAAVLASGGGAVLSHGAAAVHWGLLRPLQGPVDVSVPTQAGRRRRAGIRLHRRAALSAGDVTRRDGIPVTTPAGPSPTSRALSRRAWRGAPAARQRSSACRWARWSAPTGRAAIWRTTSWTSVAAMACPPRRSTPASGV